MNPDGPNSICLECGLCCNGVIFADGRLEPEDDSERLRSLGLPLTRPAGRGRAGGEAWKWPQPCAALDGCRCRIYADRPKYCRQFECLLFKKVSAGQVDRPAAVRRIRATLSRAAKVRKLLRALGDDDESASLSGRFRRTRRRIESAPADRPTAVLFGELTLAVHELNVVLSEEFYPGR
jgi:Fe-S-cluster containining protein